MEIPQTKQLATTRNNFFLSFTRSQFFSSLLLFQTPFHISLSCLGLISFTAQVTSQASLDSESRFVSLSYLHCLLHLFARENPKRRSVCMSSSLIELHRISASLVPTDDSKPVQCVIHDSFLAAILEDEKVQAVAVAEMLAAEERAICEREFFECYEIINDMLREREASASPLPSSPPTPLILPARLIPLPTSPLTISPPELTDGSTDGDDSEDWEDTDSDVDSDVGSDDIEVANEHPLALVPFRFRRSTADVPSLPLSPPSTPRLRPYLPPRHLTLNSPISTLLAPHLTPSPSTPVLTTATSADPTKLKKSVHFHPSHTTRIYHPNSKAHIFSSSTFSSTHAADYTGWITHARAQSYTEMEICNLLDIDRTTLYAQRPSQSRSHSPPNDFGVQKAKSTKRPCLCVQRYLRRVRHKPAVEIEDIQRDHSSINVEWHICLCKVDTMHQRFIEDICSANTNTNTNTDADVDVNTSNCDAETDTLAFSTSPSLTASPRIPTQTPQPTLALALAAANTYITNLTTSIKTYLQKTGTLDYEGKKNSCPDEIDMEVFEESVASVREKLEEVMCEFWSGVRESERERERERQKERQKEREAQRGGS